MNTDASLLITHPIELTSIIGQVFTYDELVKGVVDIETGELALGGEYHIDAEKILIDNGSNSDNTWGFNIYFDEKSIIFTSMINIKPRKGNKTNLLQDPEIIKLVSAIIHKYIL